MDSRPRVTPAPPASAPLATAPVGDEALLVAEAPPGALARLGRMIPGVDAVVRFAYRTAAVSAVSAVLAAGSAWWWLVQTTWTLDGGTVPDDITGRAWFLLAVMVGVTLIPAGAAALAGWTLADIVSIPRQLRDAALQMAGREPGAQAAKKGSRLLGVVRSIWAARGVALLSKGTWMKGVGALRFLRLASLPFALALVVLFALNGVVILAGVVALLFLLF